MAAHTRTIVAAKSFGATDAFTTIDAPAFEIAPEALRARAPNALGLYAEAINTDTVRSALKLTLRAAWCAFAKPASEPRGTDGLVVYDAIAVLIFAIAQLNGRAHTAHATPARAALAVGNAHVCAGSAFAFGARACRQPGWRAHAGGIDAFVGIAVAVIIQGVTAFKARIYAFVAILAAPQTLQHALATNPFGHTTGGWDNQIGIHGIFVGVAVAIVVFAIAKLGFGATCLFTHGRRTLAAPKPLAAFALGRTASARNVVNDIVAVIILAVADLFAGTTATLTRQCVLYTL